MMASRFQHRLVGTVVLVSLGVIFLPDIFDGKKETYQPNVVSIPLRPADNTQHTASDILPPVLINASEDNKTGDLALSTEPAVAKRPLPELKVTNIQGDTEDKWTQVATTKSELKENAWIIQLMALKNVDRAKKLVKELQTKGYRADLIQEKRFARVIVGPDLSKAQLEKQLKGLESITGSKGQIMKFSPKNH
ncbi:SPOR domain-containing protein [Vibrio sp.]|nr:SPOR domain-containing protein [Vibrio sp.]